MAFKGLNVFRTYFLTLKNNPNLFILWLSSAISMFGDWANLLAIYAIFNSNPHTRGHVFYISVFNVLRSTPPFFLSPITGSLADKVDRRVLMIVADMARAFLVLLYILTWAFDGLVWLIYPVTLAEFSFQALFLPSYSGLVPQVVRSQEELVVANTLQALTWSSVLLIGSAVGGSLTAFFGPVVCFVLDSVSFLASALCLVILLRQPLGSGNFLVAEGRPEAADETDAAKEEESPEQHSGHDGQDDIELLELSEKKEEEEEAVVVEEEEEEEEEGRVVEEEVKGWKKAILFWLDGFHFLKRHPIVCVLIFAKWTLCSSAGLALMFDMRVSTEDYPLGSSSTLTLTLVYLAIGVATTLTPLTLQVMGLLDGFDHNRRTLGACFVFLALGTFGLAASPPTPFAVGLPVFLLGELVRTGAQSTIWICSSFLLQTLVPNEFRGRVFSIEIGLCTIGEALMILVSGVLIDTLLSNSWVLRGGMGVAAIFYLALSVVWGYFLFWKLKQKK